MVERPVRHTYHVVDALLADVLLHLMGMHWPLIEQAQQHMLPAHQCGDIAPATLPNIIVLAR